MAVYVFVHDQHADWELGYLLPELRSPSPAPRVEKSTKTVVTFGLTSASVVSMGGLRITPDVALHQVEADQVEAVVLPGGTFWATLEPAGLDELVRATRERRALLAGICAATGYLARLGILDAVAHTSNGRAFLAQYAPHYGGAAHYRDALAASDDGVITASGLGAVDFTYEILRHLGVYPPAVADVWLRAFKHGEDPFRSS
jgi:putative intracellular protease/amidase